MSNTFGTSPLLSQSSPSHLSLSDVSNTMGASPTLQSSPFHLSLSEDDYVSNTMGASPLLSQFSPSHLSLSEDDYVSNTFGTSPPLSQSSPSRLSPSGDDLSLTGSPPPNIHATVTDAGESAIQEQSAHFDQHSNDEDDAIYGGLLSTHDAATIHVDTSDEENSSLSDEYSEPEDPFIYDSNASSESDGDDPLYQPGSSPLPSDDSPSDSDGGGDDDDDDIKEVKRSRNFW